VAIVALAVLAGGCREEDHPPPTHLIDGTLAHTSSVAFEGVAAPRDRDSGAESEHRARAMLWPKRRRSDDRARRDAGIERHVRVAGHRYGAGL
jgi:hypothetical protein